MLLGGIAGHGLEPVRIVGGSLFNGPILHGTGDFVGNGAVEGGSLTDATLPGYIDLRAKTLLHLFLAEDHAAEDFRDVDGVGLHGDHSFLRAE